jgi:hypothetical protein
VPVLDRERERRANLIAVERAVTWPAHPARALARPIGGPEVLARRDVARLVAVVAVAARPVILHAVEAPEAEAVVRQPHRSVGIALAGRDRVAHAGDQHVTHLDFAHDPLRRAVAQDDVDARHRGSAVADA